MKQTAVTRPTGLTILAMLVAVVGLFALTLGVALNRFAGAMSEIFSTTPTFALPGTIEPLFGPLGLTFGDAAIISALFGVAYIAWGVGAYRLRPWAWTLGIVLTGVSFVSFGLSLITTGSAPLLDLVAAAALFAYLNLPHVKAAFGR